MEPLLILLLSVAITTPFALVYAKLDASMAKLGQPPNKRTRHALRIGYLGLLAVLCFGLTCCSLVHWFLLFSYFFLIFDPAYNMYAGNYFFYLSRTSSVWDQFWIELHDGKVEDAGRTLFFLEVVVFLSAAIFWHLHFYPE